MLPPAPAGIPPRAIGSPAGPRAPAPAEPDSPATRERSIRRRATRLIALLALATVAACTSARRPPALPAAPPPMAPPVAPPTPPGPAAAPARVPAPVFLPDSIVAVDGIRTSFGWYRHRGLRLRGILFEPKPRRFGGGRRPAIVFNHGGVSGISRDVISRARELARRGYVVFTPSYRGEDGSDGRIEVAHGEVDDVLGAFEILAARSDVDSTRIAMLGSSHGALITVLAMSREPRIRAGVAAYGVMNIEAWYRWLVANEIDVSDTLSVRIYGSGPDERPEVFRARNATLVAHRIRSPLLVVQGRKDRTVPPEQAIEFGKVLKAVRHRDHRVKIYPHLGHNFLFWTTPGFHTPVEMREAARAWKDVTSFLDRKVKRIPLRNRVRH